MISPQLLLTATLALNAYVDPDAIPQWKIALDSIKASAIRSCFLKHQKAALELPKTHEVFSSALSTQIGLRMSADEQADIKKILAGNLTSEKWVSAREVAGKDKIVSGLGNYRTYRVHAREQVFDYLITGSFEFVADEGKIRRGSIITLLQNGKSKWEWKRMDSYDSLCLSAGTETQWSEVAKHTGGDQATVIETLTEVKAPLVLFPEVTSKKFPVAGEIGRVHFLSASYALSDEDKKKSTFFNLQDQNAFTLKYIRKRPQQQGIHRNQFLRGQNEKLVFSSDLFHFKMLGVNQRKNRLEGNVFFDFGRSTLRPEFEVSCATFQSPQIEDIKTCSESIPNDLLNSAVLYDPRFLQGHLSENVRDQKVTLTTNFEIDSVFLKSRYPDLEVSATTTRMHYRFTQQSHPGYSSAPNPMSPEAQPYLRSTSSFDFESRAFKKGLEPYLKIQSVNPELLKWEDKVTFALVLTDILIEKKSRSETEPIPLTASAVLERREGVCLEHAILAAALLRKFGVPARILHGISPTLGAESQQYTHAWIQIARPMDLVMDSEAGIQWVWMDLESQLASHKFRENVSAFINDQEAATISYIPLSVHSRPDVQLHDSGYSGFIRLNITSESKK